MPRKKVTGLVALLTVLLMFMLGHVGCYALDADQVIVPSEDDLWGNDGQQGVMQEINEYIQHSAYELLPLDNNTGDKGSYFQGIPEPMVFDLVRPLGARRGEWEINTLGRLMRPGKSLEAQWAPEIEVAIWDNVALELEFPFQNQTLLDLKSAVQVTLPSRKRYYAHGIQVIGEHHLDNRSYSLTPLYISGLNLSPKWGVIGINGLNVSDIGRSNRLSGIVNLSLFRVLNDRYTLGLEHNVVVRAGIRQLSVIPQIHRELGKHFSMQAGAGLMYSRDQNRWRPLIAVRLIRTF